MVNEIASGDIVLVPGTITDPGNVGIGTSSPAQRLHIKGTTATNTQMFLETSEWNSIGDYAQINFGNLVDHYIRGEYGKGITVYDVDGVNMPKVYTQSVSLSTQALYIDVNGKLGYNASSIKYKENVNNLENVDWLFALRPVTYNYKVDQPTNIQYGLIAEEVNEANPLLVIYGADKSPDGLMYEKLVVPMLKAIQKQQKELDSSKQENQQLKSELQSLREEVEQIKAILPKSNTK
jgi:hypothetical protein